jgi:hypothetical protein
VRERGREEGGEREKGREKERLKERETGKEYERKLTRKRHKATERLWVGLYGAGRKEEGGMGGGREGGKREINTGCLPCLLNAFSFPDNTPQYIFLGFAFSNSIAFGFCDMVQKVLALLAHKVLAYL